MSTPTDEPPNRPAEEPSADGAADARTGGADAPPPPGPPTGPGAPEQAAEPISGDPAPAAAGPASDAAPERTPDPTPESSTPAPPLPSWAGPATGEGPVVPADLPATPVAEPKAETPGTGQHAAPRPYPPSATVTRVSSAESLAAARAGLTTEPPTGQPPTPAAETVVVPPPAQDATPGPATTAVLPAPTPAPAPAPTPPPAPAAALGPAQAAGAAAREPVDLPEPPAKPGAARHVLGVLVGLVLTPVALVLTAVGVGRFLAVDDAATAYDMTGLGLVLTGTLLLAVVVLLGLWSPAVPLTGGLVWGVGVAVLYLGWPALVEDLLDSAYSTRPPALDQLTTTLNDGTWLVLGVLITVAGLTLAIARRMGRRYGERRVSVEHVRAEAARAEEARRRTAEAEEAARAERARAIT